VGVKNISNTTTKSRRFGFCNSKENTTMETKRFKFQFTDKAGFNEVVATLGLARIAAESLYGVDRVDFEFGYAVNEKLRVVLITTTGQAGYDLVVMFHGFARLEFGRSSMTMTQPKAGG
jgi:hypothetical protein